MQALKCLPARLRWVRVDGWELMVRLKKSTEVTSHKGAGGDGRRLKERRTLLFEKVGAFILRSY